MPSKSFSAKKGQKSNLVNSLIQSYNSLTQPRFVAICNSRNLFSLITHWIVSNHTIRIVNRTILITMIRGASNMQHQPIIISRLKTQKCTSKLGQLSHMVSSANKKCSYGLLCIMWSFRRRGIVGLKAFHLVRRQGSVTTLLINI